jgi:hypothetical protein
MYILIETFLFSKAEKRLICLGVRRFAVIEFKHRKVVRLKTCKFEVILTVHRR